jgi:deoxyribonuclease V
VEARDRLGPVRFVAGVDVAYEVGGPALFAAAVVLDAGTLDVVDEAVVQEVARFPYVPGLFSFREAPPLLAALGRLTVRPQLVVCDGHGLAHPRRCGLASHLGVELELPTIGCAKKRLCGRHQEPGLRRGCHRRLVDRGEVVGEVLRTRDGVKPVYVSVGHRVSLETARRWILALTPRYRLPETTRAADGLANRARRQARQQARQQAQARQARQARQQACQPAPRGSH